MLLCCKYNTNFSSMQYIVLYFYRYRYKKRLIVLNNLPTVDAISIYKKLLLFYKYIFTHSTNRAYPIFGYILERCSWSNSCIWIAFGWIINITTWLTYILFHNFLFPYYLIFFFLRPPIPSPILSSTSPLPLYCWAFVIPLLQRYEN